MQKIYLIYDKSSRVIFVCNENVDIRLTHIIHMQKEYHEHSKIIYMQEIYTPYKYITICLRLNLFPQLRELP